MAEGPTARRRRLGQELRLLRKQKSVGLEDAGQVVGVSRSTLNRWERGMGAVKPPFVRSLCEHYGAPLKKRKVLMELAQDVTFQGWWEEYQDAIPERVTPLLMLEDEAQAEWHWASSYVPGLLQAREYAEAVLRATEPREDQEEIDRKVEVRMQRQNVLRRDDPLHLEVVLDEAVIRREVGGPAVMAGQLQRLVESSGPTLDLRVLPFEAGAHDADSPTFMIIRRAEQEMDVVHTSHLTGSLFLETEADLSRHRVVFAALQERALDPERSRELIESLGRQYAARA